MKRLVLLIALVVASGGCTHVAPYAREHLSEPSMDLSREAAEERFRAHIKESREGAIGASGNAGGGCGCN